jgi:toxin FitB
MLAVLALLALLARKTAGREARKGDRSDRGVSEFFDNAGRNDTALFLSAITIGELRQGAEIIRHRGDSAQSARLERWLDRLTVDYTDAILPFDQEMAQIWGRLRMPHPENPLDKQIAATALIFNLLIREIIRTVAHEYGWPDYAPPVRTVATIDSKSFDPYVGAYRFASGPTVTFWRDGDHFKNRIFGQRVVEMFPTSEHEYFEKVVDARWIFPTSDHLTVTLYQNNRERVVTRLGDVEGRAALDFSIATEKRFLDQRAASESEAALRRLITGLATGTPNYDEMVPAFAELTHQELPGLQVAITRLGALQSMSFTSVGAAGEDIYEVQFEHGSREFRILLEMDGRIHAAEFSP